MKVLARAKVPKTIQRNFSLRTDIPSRMVCALSEDLADSYCLPRAVKREHCVFPSVQRAHLPICILCVQ